MKNDFPFAPILTNTWQAIKIKFSKYNDLHNFIILQLTAWYALVRLTRAKCFVEIILSGFSKTNVKTLSIAAADLDYTAQKLKELFRLSSKIFAHFAQ